MTNTECADVFLNTETGMYEVRTMSEVFAEYPTRAEAEQDLEKGESMMCQSTCKTYGECKGEVEKVTVYGVVAEGKGLVDATHKHGTFNYCQQAIENDTNAGFIVMREGEQA